MVKFISGDYERLTESTEVTDSSKVSDLSLHRSGGNISVLCDQIRDKTSNMRSGHRCTGQLGLSLKESSLASCV
jgi:hypothetical protein